MSEPYAEMRWDPYSLSRGSDFESFWKAHLSGSKRKVLFVVGKGFDPRSLDCIDAIAGKAGDHLLWLMAFDNGLEDSKQRSEMTDANMKRLGTLFDPAQIHTINVKMDTSTQRNATAMNTRREIRNAGSLSAFDDVVVDISAMPRMVALTTVAKILYDLDAVEKDTGQNVNLHVTTAESVAIDRGAGGGSLSESVTMVAGFSGALSSQGEAYLPRVWLPVLGEGQGDRLVLIREEVDPDEICPVIPFPSRESRRGDEIIAEHRQILFEEFQVEPGNILHACEYNPFEAYKQLFTAMERYRVALSELGGCKALVSPISSKLLSIGALLACYDHKYGKVGPDRLKVGMPYVETAVYSDPEIASESDTELFSMWLRGEWEQ